MKIYRKNDGGPRGEVKSEHVQCMMGLEAVKVFEPSVFILNSGDTPMMDQNTSRMAHMMIFWLLLPGSGVGHGLGALPPHRSFHEGIQASVLTIWCQL